MGDAPYEQVREIYRRYWLGSGARVVRDARRQPRRDAAAAGRARPWRTRRTMVVAVAAPAADTDAMAAVIRTALVCAVLACAGCSVAGAPPPQFAAPAMGGGGNDGGNGGGMGGSSGGM